MYRDKIICGHALNVLRRMPDESVHCVVTSPPYWGLRDYGIEPQVWGGDPECEHEWTEHVQSAANGIVNSEMQGKTLSGRSATRKPKYFGFCRLCGAWRGSLGLEPTPELYVEHLIDIFREVWRVLRPDGTLWLNLGDCYHSGDRGGYRKDSHRWENCPLQSKAKGSHLETVSPNRLRQKGLKDKDMVGIPWRVAFALQAAGWWIRRDIIWSKPNPMPESVTDRPTTAHEYLFLLSKSARYYYDAEAIKEEVIYGDHPRNGVPGPPVQAPGQPLQSGFTNRRRKGTKDKIPAGWELGPGHHGTLNKNGLGGAYSFARKTATEGKPGELPQHRLNREDIEYRGTRNRRSVWTIATQPFPEAHFATFPEALIEPCILAGTSERGICAKCGAPWGRVVKKTGERLCHSGSRKPSELMRERRGERSLETSIFLDGKVNQYETITWRPSCSCDADIARPIVFDPFAGAGTVGLVAKKLNRDFLLIEIKPEYCEMARRRIRGRMPLFVGDESGDN